MSRTCSSFSDRKSTRLNSSHPSISYAVFCLKKKIPVAELLVQVEPQPVGELDGAGDGVAVVGEPLDYVLGSEEHRLVVAPPLALAAVERRAAANSEVNVRKRRAKRMVRVHVACGGRRNADRLREDAEKRIAAGVAALVRALFFF